MKKLKILLGLVVFNVAGAALLGSRLFGNDSANNYSNQPSSNHGAWTSETTTVEAVAVSGPCGSSTNGGVTTVQLCFSVVDITGGPPSGASKVNGVVVPQEVVDTEWARSVNTSFATQ